MHSSESLMASLDTEFDQYLVDMKPYVIRLPHKSDRQRCALWIKKLCEPPSTGVTGRKNRNQYSQLLSQMLKNGQLEGIFTQKPESGPLQSLPSYMSVYFDDLHIGGDGKENRVPDWVAGELPSDLTSLSSIHMSDIQAPLSGHHHFTTAAGGDRGGLTGAMSASAAAGRNFEEVRDRFNDAVGRSPRSEQRYKDSLFSHEVHRSRSPPLISREERVPPLHLDDFSPTYPKLPKGRALFPEDDDSTTNGEFDFDFTKPKTRASHRLDSDDWRNPSYGTSILKDNSYRNDSTKLVNERDLEQKAKMMEARFQEEKLRLQQKHDSNVQKILERKNTELEDLKAHYRNKSKEQDVIVHKLEKKVQQYQKEATQTKELKDQQIEELTRRSDEYNQSKQTELEKKLHDTVAQFEEEKFSLQKQQTHNIQDLLDDTNNRLQKMESEYSQQMESTTSVIQELESRVHELSGDAETLGKIRNQLQTDKSVLQERCDRLQADVMDYQARNTAAEKELGQIREEHEKEIRSLRNKHEASVDFIKQEHHIHSTKNSDTMTDMEGQVSQLRQALDRAEQDHNRHIREVEEQHYQDKVHVEHLHEKKLKHLQQELDQLEEGSQKKLRKLEECVREKEDDLMRLKLLQEQKSNESDRALETFKSEVERSSSIMYDDLKKQMEKVGIDLNRSKQLREKQAKEFQRQLQEEKYRHEQQITELQLAYEQDKSRVLSEVHDEKQTWKNEKEAEVETLKTSLHRDMGEMEAKARDRQERDTKTISELDAMVQKLREEVVNSNQLRKQQLVELGLLREEEKQKMSREHEQEISQLQYSFDQQRLEAEKQHGAEMEATLEKTNSKLKDIESEYSSQLQKANQLTIELQATVEKLKGNMERIQQESQSEISQTSFSFEEERRKWKQQHTNAVMSLQQEGGNFKSKLQRAERKLVEAEQDHDEKVCRLRAQYEEKMRNMVSAAVRQELEETIGSLKSQTKSLQQRCALLQDQIDYPDNKYSGHSNQFNFSNNSSATASIKSVVSSLKEVS